MGSPLGRREAKIGAVALAGIAVCVLTVQGTLAAFTNQTSVGGTTFSAGVIDLAISPASALVTYSGMHPGDTTTSSILVSNAPGSSALRYAISSSATDDDGKGLKDQLLLTVRTADATTPGTPCDDFDGTLLYRGDLDSTDGKIVGDPAQGAQAGDRDLSPGGSETLCFRVTLPSATSADLAGASTTATFAFDAEQTANN